MEKITASSCAGRSDRSHHNGVGFETGAGTGSATDFATRTVAADGGGYGMLSMAERAELVGGTLTVRSQPGSGTTVTVTVPIDE